MYYHTHLELLLGARFIPDDIAQLAVGAHSFSTEVSEHHLKLFETAANMVRQGRVWT